MSSQNLPLAAITYQRGFDVDDLLLRTCARLRTEGLQIGGVIQRTSGDRGQCASHIHVIDLRSGNEFNIWEDRGACSRGCRLDERGLFDAEPTIMAALADRVDLLVINRFGRAESLGRGLVGCFVAALEARVPVLTAVRKPYHEVWSEFHSGLARTLPDDLTAITAWCLATVGRSGATANSPGHPDAAMAASAVSL